MNDAKRQRKIVTTSVALQRPEHFFKINPCRFFYIWTELLLRSPFIVQNNVLGFELYQTPPMHIMYIFQRRCVLHWESLSQEVAEVIINSFIHIIPNRLFLCIAVRWEGCTLITEQYIFLCLSMSLIFIGTSILNRHSFLVET